MTTRRPHALGAPPRHREVAAPGRSGGFALAGRRREAGTATSELAVALPALVLVLGVALAAVDLGIAQVRCVDAARTAARLLARGEPSAVAVGEAQRAAPTGSAVVVSSGADRVTVEVTAPVPALLRPLGSVDPPRAVAVARLEVGVDAGVATDPGGDGAGARGSP